MIKLFLALEAGCAWTRKAARAVGYVRMAAEVKNPSLAPGAINELSNALTKIICLFLLSNCPCSCGEATCCGTNCNDSMVMLLVYAVRITSPARAAPRAVHRDGGEAEARGGGGGGCGGACGGGCAGEAHSMQMCRQSYPARRWWPGSRGPRCARIGTTSFLKSYSVVLFWRPAH